MHGQCKTYEVFKDGISVGRFVSAAEASKATGLNIKQIYHRASCDHAIDGISIKVSSNFCDEGYFENESSNVYYLLGYIYADGSLKEQEYSSKDGIKVRQYVRFGSKDEELIQFIKSELKCVHKIQSWKGKPDFKHLEIGSKKLYQSLCDRGMSPRKTYHDSDIHINPLYERDFWRGFIDGDGTVTYDRKYLRIIAYFCTCSATMILKYKDFLNRNGIKFGEHVRDTELGFSMTQIYVENGPSIEKLSRILYDNDEFALERKRKRVFDYYGICRG